MTIQRMEHVGIVVDDLAAATAFFVELASPASVVVPGQDPLAGSPSLVRRAGVSEAVGVGAGFDDGAVVGEPVDDGHRYLDL